MGPVVGSLSSNHHRVKTLLPLTLIINLLLRVRGVVSIFAIVSSMYIPTCLALRIKGGMSAPKCNSLPASRTVSYYHYLSARLMSLRISLTNSQSSSSWMITLSISNHHFWMIIHASVAKLYVKRKQPRGVILINMHVCVVNHGIAIDALPVCYFTSHSYG